MEKEISSVGSELVNHARSIEEQAREPKTKAAAQQWRDLLNSEIQTQKDKESFVNVFISEYSEISLLMDKRKRLFQPKERSFRQISVKESVGVYQKCYCETDSFEFGPAFGDWLEIVRTAIPKTQTRGRK